MKQHLFQIEAPIEASVEESFKTAFGQERRHDHKLQIVNFPAQIKTVAAEDLLPKKSTS